MSTVMEHEDITQAQKEAIEYSEAQNTGFIGTKEEYLEYRDYT